MPTKPAVVPDRIYRQCTSCDNWKPLESAFKKTPSGKYYRRVCMSCHATRSRAKNPNAQSVWYRNNRERQIESVRQYRSENPWVSRLRAANKRCRDLDALGDPFTVEEMISSWFKRGIDSNYCVYCGDPAESIEHVIPISRGGFHSKENTVPACIRCNCSKGTQLVEEWLNRA